MIKDNYPISDPLKYQPYENDLMTSSVASSSECTGLTRILPENDEEVESYEDIYNIPLTPYEFPPAHPPKEIPSKKQKRS